jgi:hypothetical protein
MIPLCIFWCIWWERNSRSFEGAGGNMLQNKGTVIRTLMDWSNASGAMFYSSFLDFLDLSIA